MEPFTLGLIVVAAIVGYIVPLALMLADNEPWYLAYPWPLWFALICVIFLGVVWLIGKVLLVGWTVVT